MKNNRKLRSYRLGEGLFYFILDLLKWCNICDVTCQDFLDLDEEKMRGKMSDE